MPKEEKIGGGWPVSENRHVFRRGHAALNEEPAPAVTNSDPKPPASPPSQWPARRFVPDSRTTGVMPDNFAPGC